MNVAVKLCFIIPEIGIPLLSGLEAVCKMWFGTVAQTEKSPGSHLTLSHAAGQMQALFARPSQWIFFFPSPFFSCEGGQTIVYCSTRYLYFD